MDATLLVCAIALALALAYRAERRRRERYAREQRVERLRAITRNHYGQSNV